MALPLTGFDLICLGVPNESQIVNLCPRSSICAMEFLKALFTVKTSALFDAVRKHLPTVHCYVDNSQ